MDFIMHLIWMRKIFFFDEYKQGHERFRTHPLRDLTENTLPFMPCPCIFCMQGTVGANLCVRPVIPGRNAGLSLQSCTEKWDFIFWGIPYTVFFLAKATPA